MREHPIAIGGKLLPRHRLPVLSRQVGTDAETPAVPKPIPEPKPQSQPKDTPPSRDYVKNGQCVRGCNDFQQLVESCLLPHITSHHHQLMSVIRCGTSVSARTPLLLRIAVLLKDAVHPHDRPSTHQSLPKNPSMKHQQSLSLSNRSQKTPRLRHSLLVFTSMGTKHSSFTSQLSEHNHANVAHT